MSNGKLRDEQSVAQSVLAVILGASVFPRSPKLAAGRAFHNSAADFMDYLSSPSGLALPPSNIHWLFDDSRNPSDLLDEVASFVQRRSQELERAGMPVRDLIVYYVGHGLFTRGDQQYSLAVRATNHASEGSSSIRASDLALTLKDNAPFVRRFLILDSCFAASIYKEFQSAPLSVARVQILDGLPKKGTALLCSSNSRDPSLAPEGLSHTMFSDALLIALKQGHVGLGPKISVSELGQLVKLTLQLRYPESWVRPEVLSPDQRDGDIADLPIFPNPSYLAGAQIPVETSPSFQATGQVTHIPDTTASSLKDLDPKFLSPAEITMPRDQPNDPRLVSPGPGPSYSKDSPNLILYQLKQPLASIKQLAKSTPAKISAVSIFIIFIGWFGYSLYLDWEVSRFTHAIRDQPGIQISSIGRAEGRYQIKGFRDPLSADPHVFLEQAGLDPRDVVFDLTPYVSSDDAIVLKRAEGILAPPAEVKLTVQHGELRAEGLAAAEWIAQLKDRAPTIAGVNKVDASHLQDLPPGSTAQLKLHDADQNGNRYIINWDAEPNCSHFDNAPNRRCNFTRTQTKFAGDSTPYDHWELKLEAPGPVTSVVCQPTGSNEFNQVKGDTNGEIDGHWGTCKGWINGGNAPIRMTVYYQQRW